MVPHSYPAGGSLRPDPALGLGAHLPVRPISRWWKGTACLGAACVFLPGQPGDRPAGAAGRRDGGAAPRLLVPAGFHPMAENWYFNENVLLLLWLALVAAAALCALRALLRRREA
ncbi:MAG: hypothetical protein ACLRWQ_06505 [Flavonifractor plautii]